MREKNDKPAERPNRRGNTSVRSKERRACDLCSFRFAKDKSLCPSCGHFNVPNTVNDGNDGTVLLSDVAPTAIKFYPTGPWDKCFSKAGGLPTTAVALLGGQPGAGKSTMCLQIADVIASSLTREVLIVAAEVMAEEIRLHAERLRLSHMHLIRIYPIGCQSDLLTCVDRYKPGAVFVDSIPGLTDDPELAVELCQSLKDQVAMKHTPCVVIDHVTKEKDFAGLEKLKHTVDMTVMLMRISQKDDDPIRHLLSTKNRFGPEHQMFLQMTDAGLIQYVPDDSDDA